MPTNDKAQSFFGISLDDRFNGLRREWKKVLWLSGVPKASVVARLTSSLSCDAWGALQLLFQEGRSMHGMPVHYCLLIDTSILDTGYGVATLITFNIMNVANYFWVDSCSII